MSKIVQYLKENIVVGNYYCGIGSKYAIKRNISELHLEYCLYAGLKISGINDLVHSIPTGIDFKSQIFSTIKSNMIFKSALTQFLRDKKINEILE